jgi:thiol-disulfide isomerase/thioredoxin
VPDYTAALNKDLGTGKALGAGKALGTAAGPSAALVACEQDAGSGAPALRDCGTAPPLAGIAGWLNTPGGGGLDLPALHGKVVLVDFWAYSCINCQRAIAHVNAWYAAYRSAGFEVIGVHTPEYAFEHVPSNVAAGAKRLGIRYPVALDNGYATWNNYGNDSWPADYLIDASGTVRFTSIGEGEYGQTEQLIRQLLDAAHPGRALPGGTSVPDLTPTADQSPETYLGTDRAQYYENDTAPLANGTHTYHYPAHIDPGYFALTGTWSVTGESITAGKNAGIALNFLADDVYLDVGGTGTLTVTVDRTTTRYRVSGAPNIYPVLHRDHQESGVLQVDLSPGLSAYSFTFG